MSDIASRSDVSQAAARGVTPAGLASLIHRAVDAAWRALQRRRTRQALLALDAHLLKDIGRTRREACEEGQKPFWK